MLVKEMLKRDQEVILKYERKLKVFMDCKKIIQQKKMLHIQMSMTEFYFKPDNKAQRRNSELPNQI